MIALVQLLIGVETYISMLDNWFMAAMVHIIALINSYYLLKGEKYYNENVGAE